MESITEAIENLIEFIETIWELIGNILSGITVAFDILARIITLAYEFIATTPAYIQAFMIMTIVVSVVYFIVGRSTGKSDNE